MNSIEKLFDLCNHDLEQLFDYNKAEANLKHIVFKDTVFYQIAPQTVETITSTEYTEKASEIILILSLCKRSLSIVGQKINNDSEIYSKLNVP